MPSYINYMSRRMRLIGGIAFALFVLVVVEIRITENIKINNSPNIPSSPSGPFFGVAKTHYCGFNCCTTDPDGDKIHYIWDFGDGCGFCTICLDCGCKSCLSHCYMNNGWYYIRVMAMDEHYAESEWSLPHIVYIFDAHSEC